MKDYLKRRISFVFLTLPFWCAHLMPASYIACMCVFVRVRHTQCAVSCVLIVKVNCCTDTFTMKRIDGARNGQCKRSARVPCHMHLRVHGQTPHDNAHNTQHTHAHIPDMATTCQHRIGSTCGVRDACARGSCASQFPTFIYDKLSRFNM